MLSVDEAVARISAAFSPLGAEQVSIDAAAGRILSEDAVARLDQPPAPMSAMDGYAVRAADIAEVKTELSVIGDAPAGSPFPGKLGAGQAVRIFTGGVVPDGADTVVIQEDTESVSGRVVVNEVPTPGQHVRMQGLDFRAGDILFRKGRRLSARDLAVLAAADIPHIGVTLKPRVALVATGDELSRPGKKRKAGGIAASSTYALAAMVEQWGGMATDLGILADRPEAFAQLPEAARSTDLIVTQGGASVGDHDLVQRALGPLGFTLDFWKIAMRPGKPLIFGHLNATPLLGLPGNPVSAMVCAILFLRPVIAAMLGTEYRPPVVTAKLASPLKANGARQDYIRARIVMRDNQRWAEPFALQDSSMQKIFADADGLIVRKVGAAPAETGDEAEILLLDA